MVDSEENPYRSPETQSTTASRIAVPAKRPSVWQLIPFWISLPLLVAGGVLVAPADPLSMVIVMAYGLLSFCAGYALRSALPIAIRTLTLIGWGFLAIGETWSVNSGGAILMIATAVYVLLSCSGGVWARIRMGKGRTRIVICFTLGYVIGALLWFVIGSIIGAILGIELARRSFGRVGDISSGTEAAKVGER